LCGKINSGFGYRKDPINSRLAFHSGVDIDAYWGQPVILTADGIVRHAGWYKEYGKTVIVEHKNGYETLYRHLSSLNVKEGQYVKSGDVIGFAGSTGRSTGPHLHYEILKNNQKVDPARYLFRKGKKRINQRLDEITTLIGEGCSFEGDISFSSSARIDGSVKGNVRGEDVLIIGKSGFVSGEVKAVEIIVYGRIEGNIKSQRLEIKRDGSVVGDVFTRSLIVKDWAIYNGKCFMEQASSGSLKGSSETYNKGDVLAIES